MSRQPNGAGIQSMACVKSPLRPRIWSVTLLESNVLTAKRCRNTVNGLCEVAPSSKNMVSDVTGVECPDSQTVQEYSQWLV